MTVKGLTKREREVLDKLRAAGGPVKLAGVERTIARRLYVRGFVEIDSGPVFYAVPLTTITVVVTLPDPSAQNIVDAFKDAAHDYVESLEVKP